MTKIIFIIGLALLFVGTMLIGCMSSADNAESTRTSLQDAEVPRAEARQEPDAAIDDSIREFRAESEITLGKYDRRIADIKASIAAGKEESKAMEGRLLKDLEKQNRELKTTLSTYSAGGADQWKSFKHGFSRDMDDLGKSISNVFSDARK